MRRALAAIVFLVLLCAGALALSFPALTGRVVDDAHILSSPAIHLLEQALDAYEKESTNQIVVATVPSLEGIEIEDYGYQLGRHWAIGQKDKNNGAILLVAPNEHRVRIEVGYGLEGQLTDAQSSNIIQNIMLPAFRQGQMESGVVNGAKAIIYVLGGKIDFNPQTLAKHPQSKSGSLTGILIVGFIWFLLVVFRIIPWWLPLMLLGRGGRSGGGSDGSGGGFSGGGGSFGGGGASGKW